MKTVPAQTMIHLPLLEGGKGVIRMPPAESGGGEEKGWLGKGDP